MRCCPAFEKDCIAPYSVELGDFLPDPDGPKSRRIARHQLPSTYVACLSNTEYVLARA